MSITQEEIHALIFGPLPVGDPEHDERQAVIDGAMAKLGAK